MTTNQLVQNTVEVPQEQSETTDTNADTVLSVVVNYSAKLHDTCRQTMGEKLTDDEAEKMIKETDVDTAH